MLRGAELDKALAGLEITFPPGAFDSPVLVSVRPEANPPAAPLQRVGMAFHIEADGRQPQQPVIVRVPLDPSAINGASALQAFLAVYDPDSGIWVPIPSTVTLATNSVMAQLPHFTLYGLLIGKRFPADSTVTWRIDRFPQNLEPGRTAEAVHREVAEAFAEWERHLACAGIRFAEVTSGEQITLMWVPWTTLGLEFLKLLTNNAAAETIVYDPNCTIYFRDSIAGRVWGLKQQGGPDYLDIHEVAMHEIGHALGLSSELHGNERPPIMAQGDSGFGLDVLSRDDIDYLLQVYPDAEGQPPVASDLSVNIAFQTPASVVLIAHDPDDCPRSLTYAIQRNPAHGELRGAPPTVTYTPDSGYSGADSFTFKVNDGAVDSNVATVSIVVGGQPPAQSILSVSPVSLDFGSDLTELTFNITNSGGGLLPWTVREDPQTSWMGASGPEGDTSGDGSFSGSGNTTINVTVGRLGLVQGTYVSRIRVDADSGQSATVDVRMSVSPPDQPPAAPSEPNPAHGVTSVSVNVDLDWADAPRAASYDVYFGTNSTPPLVGNAISSTWVLGTLSANTNYYWRVVARNAAGDTTGDTWSFRTGSSDVAAASHFDSSDEEWRIVEFPDNGPYQTPTNGPATPSWSGVGGYPTGCISWRNIWTGTFFFQAPDAFLGDKSAVYGGTLQWDIRSNGPGSFSTADVVLVSGAFVLVNYEPPQVTGAWQTMSVTLRETAGWRVGGRDGRVPTQAEFQTALASLSAVRIRGEFNGEAVTTYLDNVIMAP